MNIEANLRKYLDQRQPNARSSSFDYCFNYFQSCREAGGVSVISSPKILELSCLQLGFYLASMGMLRASSELLQKSVKHYGRVIKAIASADPSIWEIDAHCYTEQNIAIIQGVAGQLRTALLDKATDTLVTKVMLGVFGGVPAFDTYFRMGFRAGSFNAEALRQIGSYYTQNAQIIENNRVKTLDFRTGKSTTRKYTRAKVIDMIFVTEGAAIAGQKRHLND